eukprot:CAMPEP_0201520786 /NCGR_PEP_ID=MMETSP0161_2-20130828/12554_1 /ASSEMBLY_ACC=CAM_ASM_000251 /TAXON_ID=180227 /ORGANISM="Neoparamoeba aestuarina, Strain SoJaBio B1-5/56/2" /LENGTH=262 /DNA_ID=CAMNT_0047919271 /DNA_START=149 /DNA_END=937 /DNA_ORIENTATION=-
MGCGEGNDGGSIPRREELVTLKQAPGQIKASEKARLHAVCCSLSDRPLKAPVVVCDLGKLYNKEAIIEFILERKSNPDNEINEEFQHLTSLKDVTPVTLEPNPNFDELDQGKSYPFLCPITKETFNGIHPFVFLKSCSHAVSEKILKETSDKRCPVCEALFEDDDVVPLNPDEETMEKLKDRLEAKEAQKRAKAASRKRKKGKEKKEEKVKKVKTEHEDKKQDEAEYKKSSVYQSLFLAKGQDHTFTGTTFCSTNQKGTFGF